MQTVKVLKKLNVRIENGYHVRRHSGIVSLIVSSWLTL